MLKASDLVAVFSQCLASGCLMSWEQLKFQSQVLKKRIDELPHIRDLAHAVEKPMVASAF